MKTMNSKAEIFNNIASEKMGQWNLNEFLRTHPTLAEVIIESMQHYANQIVESKDKEIAELKESIKSFNEVIIEAGTKIAELKESLYEAEEKLKEETKELNYYIKENNELKEQLNDKS